MLKGLGVLGWWVPVGVVMTTWRDGNLLMSLLRDNLGTVQPYFVLYKLFFPHRAEARGSWTYISLCGAL